MAHTIARFPQEAMLADRRSIIETHGMSRSVPDDASPRRGHRATRSVRQRAAIGRAEPQAQQVTATPGLVEVDEARAVMEDLGVVQELHVPGLEVHGEVDVRVVPPPGNEAAPHES